MVLSSGTGRGAYINVISIAWVLFLAVCIGTPVASASDITVEVIGTGRIQGNAVESGRDQAVSSGLVSAVEKIIARLLPVQARIDNFQAIDTYIYRQADEYIQDYKVLTQYKADSYYRVFIQATVSETGIKDQLARLNILSSRNGQPGILLLISEQNADDLAPKCWWKTSNWGESSVAELAVAGKMAEKGLRVVTHEKSMPDGPDKIQGVSFGSDQEIALAMGGLFNADVVIIGKSEAIPLPSSMGEGPRPFQARITAQAFSVESGIQIAVTDQTFVAMNNDVVLGGIEALSGAGLLAADDLASQMDSYWAAGKSAPADIEIVVRGTRHLGRFVMFRKILNDIPGVESIVLKEIRPDEATMTTRFHGTSENLAHALRLKPYENFGITIPEVEPQKMTVELVSAMPAVVEQTLSP